MSSHTGENLGKILSFNDETLNIEHCKHICDEKSLLQKNYSLLKSLPKKASIDTLFSRFVVETRKLIPCDEIEYSALESDLYFIDGVAGHHQCRYKLHYLNIDLGEIKFSRKEKFSDDEMEMLEIMVSGLIQPLQAKVHYHKLQIHVHDNNKATGVDAELDKLSVMTADAYIGKES